jgi:hypothetical protein
MIMADEEKNEKNKDSWAWSEHKRMWIMIMATGGLLLTAIAAWVITKP